MNTAPSPLLPPTNEQPDFKYLECPECGDKAVVPISSTAKYCHICAEDCGRDVLMNNRIALSTDKAPAGQDWRIQS